MDYENFRQMVLGANLKAMRTQEVQEISNLKGRIDDGMTKKKQKQLGFYFRYVLDKK